MRLTVRECQGPVAKLPGHRSVVLARANVGLGGYTRRKLCADMTTPAHPTDPLDFDELPDADAVDTDTRDVWSDYYANLL